MTARASAHAGNCCRALTGRRFTGSAHLTRARRRSAAIAATCPALRQQVGSNLPSQTRKVIPIDDPVFDQATLLAADAVIKPQLPGTAPVLSRDNILLSLNQKESVRSGSK